VVSIQDVIKQATLTGQRLLSNKRGLRALLMFMLSAPQTVYKAPYVDMDGQGVTTCRAMLVCLEANRRQYKHCARQGSIIKAGFEITEVVEPL